MQGILYEEQSIWLFLLVTVIMGGAAAWASGKSIAQTWRPAWQVIPYMIVLGLAVRFIHFALFEGHLIAPQYYLVDTVILLISGLLGFRFKRAEPDDNAVPLDLRAHRPLHMARAHRRGLKKPVELRTSREAAPST